MAVSSGDAGRWQCTSGSLTESLLDWLPGNEDGEARFVRQIGQPIFTPTDTESATLLPDQRPYTAWLYAELSAAYSTDNHIDSWSLNVGTVGPGALGEETQNGLHGLADRVRQDAWRATAPWRRRQG